MGCGCGAFGCEDEVPSRSDLQQRISDLEHQLTILRGRIAAVESSPSSQPYVFPYSGNYICPTCNRHQSQNLPHYCIPTYTLETCRNCGKSFTGTHVCWTVGQPQITSET